MPLKRLPLPIEAYEELVTIRARDVSGFKEFKTKWNINLSGIGNMRLTIDRWGGIDGLRLQYQEYLDVQKRKAQERAEVEARKADRVERGRYRNQLVEAGRQRAINIRAEKAARESLKALRRASSKRDMSHIQHVNHPRTGEKLKRPAPRWGGCVLTWAEAREEQREIRAMEELLASLQRSLRCDD